MPEAKELESMAVAFALTRFRLINLHAAIKVGENPPALALLNWSNWSILS